MQRLVVLAGVILIAAYLVLEYIVSSTDGSSGLSASLPQYGIILILVAFTVIGVGLRLSSGTTEAGLREDQVSP